MATTLNDTNPSIAAPTPTTDPVADAQPAGRFYRIVWRWHFYAGLFVVPFMLVLAITGIIYLFKPQLDPLMYHDLMFVAPAGEALPMTAQLQSARDAYPDAEITTFKPAEAPDRTAEIALTTADGRELTVFVDPSTAQALGTRDEATSLQHIALKLHGELMIGTTGDRLVELAAGWGLVLLITGLYLWWPRSGVRIWGMLLPRLNLRNRRIFWRDLHSVAGFWGALLLGFMFFTGMFWTGYWGDQFAQVWNQYPAQMWNDVPKSTALTGSLNQAGPKIVPWAAEQVPLPKSDTSAHADHQGQAAAAGPVVTAEGIAPGTPVDLNAVVALAQSKGAPTGYTVSLPADAEGVYYYSWSCVSIRLGGE